MPGVPVVSRVTQQEVLAVLDRPRTLWGIAEKVGRSCSAVQRKLEELERAGRVQQQEGGRWAAA